MIAHQLKQAFDKYCSFPIIFWKSLADLGETISVEKEISIKAPDHTENHLYYIIEGSGGILLWNKNNFICTDMILEGDFLCDYLSFITRQATPYEVLTFEKSTLFKISYPVLNTFLSDNTYGDKFWRYAAEALYIDKHNQYIQAFTLYATEIYRNIQQYQPEIIKRIPQKYIASFLGVTPQSLSRIRSDG